MKEEKPLSRLRMVIDTITGTLTEKTYVTGARAEAGRVMAVHRIWVFLSRGVLTNAAGVRTTEAAVSTRQGLTAIPEPDDPDCIVYSRILTEGGDPGTTAVHAISDVKVGFHGVKDFDPPVYIADDIISLYAIRSADIGAGRIDVWFDYEIVEVTLEQALRILESYR